MSSKASLLVKEIYHKGLVTDPTDGTDIDLALELFTKEVEKLAKEEAIKLADKLIGKDILVHYDRSDPMDDTPGLKKDELAVLNFQAAQRLLLAKYQNPRLEMSNINQQTLDSYHMPTDNASEMES